MAANFFKGYRRESIRLRSHDYSSNGIYFVTICAKDRQRYFGELVDKKLEPTAIGSIAENFWMRIPDHFAFVELDAFVLMPDHLHGVLRFNKAESDQPAIKQPYAEKNEPGKGGSFGPQSNNLASVIRNYKGAVTSQANKAGILFAWKPLFYERILHTRRELDIVRRYIANNPIKG